MAMSTVNQRIYLLQCIEVYRGLRNLLATEWNSAPLPLRQLLVKQIIEEPGDQQKGASTHYGSPPEPFTTLCQTSPLRFALTACHPLGSWRHQAPSQYIRDGRQS